MRNNREDNHSWNRDDRRSDRNSDRRERPSRERSSRNDEDKPFRRGRRDDDEKRQGSRGGYRRDDDRREDRGERRGYNSDRRNEGGERRGGFRRDRNDDNDSRGGYRGARRSDDDRRGDRNDRRGGFRRDRNDNNDRRGGYRGTRRDDDERRGGYRGNRRDDNDRRGTNEDIKFDKEGRKYKRVEGKPEYKIRQRKNYSEKPKGEAPKAKQEKDGRVRLNKFIANAGICSRREADVLITTGVIQVNDKVVTELGLKINPEVDVVKYDNKVLKDERKVYLLLNKPKGFITTSDDPQERKTVMELIDGACNERIYPVGRLDRNTTGLLLFTNDGELTKKLTHPSFGAAKIYNVELDRNITKKDMEILLNGVDLEDGRANVDKIDYIMDTPIDKKKVGVSIHSGKNRIIRRLFESLGYDVKKLDRVYFAGLTKKNLLRGKYRFLTEQEIAFLKMDH